MNIEQVNDYFSKILKAYDNAKEIKSFTFEIEVLTDDQYLQKRTFNLLDKDVN